MRKSMVVPLVAVLATGCGISKDKYQAKDLEAQEYKKKLNDESARSADLANKMGALEVQIAAKQKELDELTQAKTQLEQEKGELQEKSSQYEQLAGSLKGQIEAGQIELSELKGKMTVKLKDKILFASGSAALGKEGKDALDSVADAFKTLQGKNVLVEGFTDDIATKKGPYPTTWELSAARAIAVVRYLQEKGVEPKILGAAGFSQYRPLAVNHTIEGRSQNRRIEIVLTPAEYTAPEPGK